MINLLLKEIKNLRKDLKDVGKIDENEQDNEI